MALEAQRRVIERDRRVREGLARRRARERAGLRRYRPGPRVSLYAPRMAGLADPADADAVLLDREIDAIGVVLEERGTLGREALRSAVGARYWGPGRFSRALREAVLDGRAVRVSRATFGPSRSVAAGGCQRADDARR